MTALVGKIMAYYGQSISLVSAEESLTSCRGFLRPVGDKSLQHLQLNLEKWGRIDQGKYLLMVPAGQVLFVGQRVCANKIWYLVRAQEQYFAGGTAVYNWALLVREGDLDADIS